MPPSPLPRSLFDLPRDVVWAMHCSEGPVPRASVEAARAFLEKELRPWELGLDEWLGLPTRVRFEGARLLGATRDAITLTGSTSAGLTVVAQAFPWQRGDEVLAPLGEFPSNVWPWKALEPRGVSFREVPLWDGQRAGTESLESLPPTAAIDPEARLIEAIGPRTRLMTVSWVRFQDGLRLDVQRLARGCAERGVALVVDGIQGAGTLKVNLEGVSAFATATHKGLLAPQGAGLLWTEERLRAQLRPLGSWLSVEGGTDFRRPNTDFARAWLGDGRKFEQVAPGGILLTPLAASLEAINAAAPARIEAHVSELQRTLLDGLRGSAWAGEAERLEQMRHRGRIGSILGFFHGGRGADGIAAIVKDGMARRIYTSVRDGYLRVALHGYTDEEDVARVVDWFAKT